MAVDYTYTTTSTGHVSAVWYVVPLVVLVFLLASLWKVYKKAGKPGWASLIPIYNVYVLLKIVGRPVWWLLLLLIPFVNFVISIILAIDLAKSFGKGGAFGFFGLFLFGFIGYPILGFGKATYVGPRGSSTSQTPTAATPPVTV